MSTPSQGLRALASLMEAAAPEFSSAARSALSGVADQLHAAADAEAATEAARLGGPIAAPILSAFATAMIDGFFAAAHLAPTVSAPAAPAPASATS